MAIKKEAKKASKKAAASSGKRKFEFAGKVESINVKGEGPNARQFLFSLVNGKGAHFSYLLDDEDSMRYLAMASLLTGAHAGRRKVMVNAKQNPNGGPRIAIELETR